MTAHEARLLGPNAANERTTEEVYSTIRHAAEAGSTFTRLVGISLGFTQTRLLELAGHKVSIVTAPNPHANSDPTQDYPVFVATEISWV